MTALWMKAASFAAHKHHHQLRKDGRTPYIAHPFRVAMIVRDLFGLEDPEVLAAAILHDTIEDTATDYDEVCEHFGRRVADLVGALTKDMRLPEEQREDRYDQQLAESTWEARLIKLADVYDNLSDSPDAEQLARAAKKAERALELAGDDERLARAADILKKWVRAVRKET